MFPRRALIAAGCTLVLQPMAAAAAAPPDVACTLRPAAAAVAAGTLLTLRLTLRNRGAAPLALLIWNTPFEGWFGPFVRVTRDGIELPYEGPTLKRGEPTAAEYLRLPAWRSRSVSFALQPAFAADAPGRYRIEPRITLHDVVAGAAAARGTRARAQHAGHLLDCAPVEVVVR